MKSPAIKSIARPRHAKGGLLLIGYGNTLRRDDGVGPVIVARLEREMARQKGVAFLTAHQLLPEIAADLQTQRVVFIDASATLPPGDVLVRRVRPGAAQRKRLTHHVTGGYLLALARAVYGRVPGAISIEIGAADLSVGEGLSPAVQAAADSVVARLRRYIGHAPALEPHLVGRMVHHV